MNIRKSKNSDFKVIAKLDREAWKDSFKGEFIPDGEHVWRIWVEYSLTYVLVDDEDIILGTAIAFECMNKEYAIHKLFVDKAYRGNGFGTQLMAKLLSEIDVLRVDSFLTVYPKNTSALTLYTKLGFTEKKFEENFYGEEEDRFILTRRQNNL